MTTPSDVDDEATGAQDAAVDTELGRAAASLEALTAAFEERTQIAQELEATLDAVLDDPHLEVCVVGSDLRVKAISRGLAERWSQDSPVGRLLTQIAPASWRDLGELVRSAGHDRWTERPVEDGTLSARCVTEPDGVAAEAVFVLRLGRR